MNFISYIQNLAVKGGYAEYALILLAFVVAIITIERIAFLSIELAHYKRNSWIEKISMSEFMYTVNINSRLHQHGIFYHIILSFTEQAKPYDFSMIENVASQQVRKLEAGLGLLKLIAGISPLVGILGTILGIMESFSNMTGNNQDGSHFQLDNIATGISIALITTATGLIVAIVAIFLHFIIQSYANFFINKIDFLVNRIENSIESDDTHQQENSFKPYS